DGEIEDYLVSIPAYDWGDLPDGIYNTDTTGPDGPSHLITPGLGIGPDIDAETNGIPSPNADGDDNDGSPDDEDGVTLPTTITPGQPVTFTVNLTNTSGETATVYTFVDWNGDGDFDDANEIMTQTVSDGSTGGVFSLTTTVPLTASTNISLGVRVRLSTDDTLGPDGPAPDGEIEDYLVSIPAYDWGDLPDGIYNTDTTGPDGPSHLITPGLGIGPD
ncbi:MAG: hypothetical protein GY833_01340, partial [Aestuariibacter sp.]|nr:hypothetical protein [Aestuariibacter sp.]